MEEHIGRKLLITEDVHHINRNKSDNRIENLAVLSRRDHLLEHSVLSFDAEIAESMFNEGFSFQDIGDKLNVHKNCIRAYLIRNNVHKTRPKFGVLWDIDRAISLFNSGKSISYISREVGVSDVSVGNAFKVRGIHTPVSGLSWDFDKAVKLFNEGLNISQVSKIIGVRSGTVYHAFKVRGITRE
jgi:hypothetical protein